MTIVKSGILGVGGGGGKGSADRAFAQLAAVTKEERGEAEWRGGGGALLAWPTTAASLQIIMEIHISNWIHKFQNRTGLNAKAISELYKSNRVCSVALCNCFYLADKPGE
jgi:hypothetical protein